MITHKTILKITITTLIVGLLPVLIYLLDSNVDGGKEFYWMSNGGNHGPWRNGIEGMILLYLGPLYWIYLIFLNILSTYSEKVFGFYLFFNLFLTSICIYLNYKYLFWLVD